MDHLDVLEVAVGERRVGQEGFPYPWLSKGVALMPDPR